MRQGTHDGIEAHVISSVTAPGISLPAWISVGPGDDMAAIAPQACIHGVLAACDQVVEGRHFTRQTPLALVGRKVVARNISDVAAMAAEPLATLASCVLPRRIGIDGAQTLLESLRRHAAQWGAPLIGGDTAVHADSDGPLTLSVTILARPRVSADGQPRRIVLRRGARAGDALYVTGALGGSFGADGLGRHLHFEPRLAAAHALADALGDALHAMIDVSDGLGLDAGRIAGASEGQLTALIDGARVPRHAGVSLEAAISDGEDHELLLAVAADASVPESLPDGQGGSVRCTRIGSCVPRAPSMPDARSALVNPATGAVQDISRKGWMHE
jgi:thiamine-monophosphate kinase